MVMCTCNHIKALSLITPNYSSYDSYLLHIPHTPHTQLSCVPPPHSTPLYERVESPHTITVPPPTCTYALSTLLTDCSAHRSAFPWTRLLRKGPLNTTHSAVAWLHQCPLYPPTKGKSPTISTDLVRSRPTPGMCLRHHQYLRIIAPVLRLHTILETHHLVLSFPVLVLSQTVFSTILILVLLLILVTMAMSNTQSDYRILISLDSAKPHKCHTPQSGVYGITRIDQSD